MARAVTIRHDVARADWLAGDPWLTAPTFPAWSAIDLIVMHWPGINGAPVSGDPARVPAFVRGQQRYVRTNRGWNLGYSSSVDWLGRTIGIRGDQFRNAANAPAALNARSYSIQIITNLDGAMTDAQIDGVRRLTAQVLDRSPGARIIGHRDGPQFQHGATRTVCAGDRIQARVDAGEFYPTAPAPTPPPDPAPDPAPPDPDPEEVPIMFIGIDAAGLVYIGDTHTRARLVRDTDETNFLLQAHQRAGRPLRHIESGAEQLVGEPIAVCSARSIRLMSPQP